MYAITSIICAIGSNGIVVENEEALKQTVNVVKLIFTPINVTCNFRKYFWKSKRPSFRERKSK